MFLMTTPQERISARMRERRDYLGVSQEAIARQVPTTMRTYARWERGETFGYLQRLGDIARALETTESELLGGEDALTAKPSVESIAAKLDELVDVVSQLREDIAPLVNKKRR
jgi:transcriptional regulator with XRE-family HTH domain